VIWIKLTLSNTETVLQLQRVWKDRRSKNTLAIYEIKIALHKLAKIRVLRL
jgi:hypothetical protein